MLGPGWTLRIQRKYENMSQFSQSPLIRLLLTEGSQSISSDVLRPIDWEIRGVGGPSLKGRNPLEGRSSGKAASVTSVDSLVLTDSDV